MRIEIVMPIVPKAQKRSRSRAIKIKTNTGKEVYTSMHYKDNDQELYEDNFRSLLYKHKPEKPLETPLILHVVALMPIPASKSNKWKKAAACLNIMHTSKPDLDNLVKQVKDCMSGIFYLNDKQIFTMRAAKYYSQVPGWEIVLEEFRDIQQALNLPGLFQ